MTDFKIVSVNPAFADTLKNKADKAIEKLKSEGYQVTKTEVGVVTVAYCIIWYKEKAAKK